MNLCARDGCGIVSLPASTAAAVTFWLQDGSFFEEPAGLQFNTGSNGSKFTVHIRGPGTYRGVTGQVLLFGVDRLTPDISTAGVFSTTAKQFQELHQGCLTLTNQAADTRWKHRVSEDW